MTQKVEATHGHYLHYLRDGCRCDTCREGWRIHCAAQKAERLAKGLKRRDRRHGTANGYANWGCRCTRCSRAHMDEKNRRKKGSR
jgi:hypothetical protein